MTCQDLSNYPFADTFLLYKIINCSADAQLDQTDLQVLEEWDCKWHMKIHPDKCQAIRISSNKCHKRLAQNQLHGHILEVVDSGKCLSFTISHDLSRHKHTNSITSKASRTLASVAQLDAPSDWRPGGCGFNPCRVWQHSLLEIDHEIFSMVILSLPLIQEGHLSVSDERMCTILVDRLED